MSITKRERSKAARAAILKAGGGQSRRDLYKCCVSISEKLGITHQAVRAWWDRGRVPGDKVVRLATLADMQPNQVDPVVFPS